MAKRIEGSTPREDGFANSGFGVKPPFASISLLSCAYCEASKTLIILLTL